MGDSESTEDARPGPGTRAENSIHPSRKLRKEGDAQDAAPKGAPKSASPKPDHSVPKEVRDRFVAVRNQYYFHDGSRAFRDRGTRLTTSSENTEVIKSLVQIAESRGWSEITVRGTERFRREAWFAAHLAGLEVRGYRPSEFEQGRFARKVGRHGPTPPDDNVTLGESGPPVVPAGRSTRDDLLTGLLVDHGRATYRHDPRQPMSYFVKIETERGDRTIWGVDLERAIKESLTRPDIGDEVGLSAMRKDPVKVRKHERDASGALIDREHETHRSHWVLERRAFFQDRAKAAEVVRDAALSPKEAARKRPELVGTLLELHLAKLAAKKLEHPEDRERFVGLVRSALADAVARGEPLPALRLRARPAERAPTPPERESAPAR